MFSFLLESAPTPIYRRLTAAYNDALTRQGYLVEYVDPSNFTDFHSAFHYFSTCICDRSFTHLLIFDNAPLSTAYLEDEHRFAFEQFEATIVFLHHDHLCNSFIGSTHAPEHLLAGWQRVKDRSIHFCLEYANFLDLRAIGFERVYSLFHASEFTPVDSPKASASDISFVGHVLPDINQLLDHFSHLPYSHHVAADVWARLVSFDQKIDPSATAYSQKNGLKSNDSKFLSQKFAYQYSANLLTPAFRGELIKRLNSKFTIDITGGDPGYLSGTPSDRRIQREHIRYHAPTPDYSQTRHIYAASTINLNITSLQFDDAVVNRVIDIARVGGFVLTDWKSNLAKVTSVSHAIAYRSIDELNDKIDYYLSHASERREIAAQLHDDIQKNCSYDRVIQYLISKLSPMLDAETDLKCVDLGCGPHKPAGFVGVDITDRPGVDVVADLNQRFPFPDSSVDVVRAHDLIEHLPDRIHTMNEIWRICKPNATVDIRVPSTDGQGAFQDPTHVSFWNINSFAYYAENFPEHLDLCRSYGFHGTFSIVKLEHESEAPDAQIIHVRAILKAIKPAVIAGDDLAQQLKLRPTNLIIFPNWSLPSDALYLELTDVIRAMATHPDRSQLTLLLYQGNNDSSSAMPLEDVLYELVLGLFLNEGIDVAGTGLEISILNDLHAAEWDYLHQQSLYRIILTHENPSAIAAYGKELQAFHLTAFQQQQFS